MTPSAQFHVSPDPLPSAERAGYDLVCSNAAARLILETWLDSSALSWPGRFRLTVQVGESNPFPPDDRLVLRQPTVSIQAGPSADTVRIEWELAPAVAEVHPSRPEATLWLSPEALTQLELAERTFLLVILVFLLRRLGWFHAHGAALVDPAGRGWLIVGDSNCGKSTTSALLATRGWGIGTDDIGFLTRRDAKIAALGVRSQIALRPGGRALLGAVGGRVMEQRDKEGFWPEELGGVWAPIVFPQIIAFPRIGERTTITPSTSRRSLAELVKWSLWVLFEPVFAQEHLDVLGQLARQSRCFDLTLGPDLFDNPDMLQELVP